MAIKIPLEMKNGVQARNIKDLRENYDIEKVLSYFLDGRLLTWLEVRYYEEEAEQLSKLDKEDPDLIQKLCKIFDVEDEIGQDFDPKKIEIRNQRISRLKQFVDDAEKLVKEDIVAFTQEELAELYDREIQKIYLFEGDFVIPKSKKDLEYILIGNPTVEGLQDGEIKCDLEPYTIPEELADKIRLKNYIETTDFIVYDLNLSKNEFNLYNKHTKELSVLALNDETFHSEKILGSVGNQIYLGVYRHELKDYAILLYNIDTYYKKLIAKELQWPFVFSNNQNKAIYIDNKKTLLLYDLISKHTTVLVQKIYYNSKILIVKDNVYYENNDYLIAYDINKKNKKNFLNIKGKYIEKLLFYKDDIYLFYTEDCRSTYGLIKKNIQNLNDDFEEKYRFSEPFTPISDNVRRAPYFIFVTEGLGFPLYLYNMKSDELKEIASGCGYTIKAGLFKSPYRYGNNNYQTVGQFLYFRKGDADGFFHNTHKIYKIDLETLDEEQELTD